MNAYDLFFDGIARVRANTPDEARERLVSALKDVPGVFNADVGNAMLIGSDE